MGQLTIVRKYFDEIRSGNKRTEWRDESRWVQRLVEKPYVVIRNGRNGRSPYLVIQITGNSEASRDDVKAAHGEEALSHFKTDKIRAIHLGDIVEVWDPKKNDFFRDESSLLHQPSTRKTSTPEKQKHAFRDAGSTLPLDLHVNSLQRRDLTKLPKQTLHKAFEAVPKAIDQALSIAQGAQKEGRRPMLREPVEVKVGSRFSGLGTAEEALSILGQFAPPKFVVRYGCDHSPDAYSFYKERFISTAPAGDKPHFFHDVLDLAEIPEELWNKTFAEKKQHFQASALKKEAPCKTHGRKCKMPDVDMDLSGSVCKEYSAQGNKAGTEGRYVMSMLAHFADLRQRRVPIRVSENVISAEGQTAIASTMPDCDVRYIITMPEDVGFGCVRRDRGWLVGVAEPFRFFMDPNVVYQEMAKLLSANQVPQAEIWFEDEKGLKEERRSASTRLRSCGENGSLCLG